MTIPPTSELLLRWDAERPRSRQQALGMSDVGGCRKAAGFRTARQPPGDAPGSVQAVMGTAVDDAVTRVMRRMRDGGLLPPESVINEEVTFAGLTGHPDLYVPPVVRDTKTVGYTSQLESRKVNGPPLREQWQVNLYAAALILTGREVTTVQLDYIARDSGDTWLWTAPFHVERVREAVAWLRTVRETPLEYLARDYSPASVYCKSCPFFTPCWDGGVPGRDPRSVILLEDGDALGWQRRLEDARRRRREAAAEEDLARGVLDALRPNDEGRGEVWLKGAEHVLRWTVSQSRHLDGDQVRADYEQAGAAAPVKASPRVTLTLAAPPDGRTAT